MSQVLFFVIFCGSKPAPSFLLAEWMSHSDSLLTPHHPVVVPLTEEVRGQKCSKDTTRGVCIVCVYVSEREKNMLPVMAANHLLYEKA